jgi:hypothetical protein
VFDDLGIDRDSPIEHPGHRPAGAVILGRSETTAQENEVRALERRSKQIDNVVFLVADDRLQMDLHSCVVEAPCHVKRIGVGVLGCEQLGSHCDYLGLH